MRTVFFFACGIKQISLSETKRIKVLIHVNKIQICICSAVFLGVMYFGFSATSQFAQRSCTSPDKHIDFKIKCVPTAGAQRLEQTGRWHCIIIKYIFTIHHPFPYSRCDGNKSACKGFTRRARNCQLKRNSTHIQGLHFVYSLQNMQSISQHSWIDRSCFAYLPQTS